MMAELTSDDNQEDQQQFRRRIDVILDGTYTDGIDDKTDSELREMRDVAKEIETEISFLRRLAQSRLDIYKAEKDRRAKGGSLSDLIAALPSILASGETRSSVPNSRLNSILAPSPDIDFKRGMESLVSDDSLANLDLLSDDELKDSMIALEGFEEETSVTRKKLHSVIDEIENKIAQRVIKQ